MVGGVALPAAMDLVQGHSAIDPLQQTRSGAQSMHAEHPGAHAWQHNGAAIGLKHVGNVQKLHQALIHAQVFTSLHRRAEER